jgi:hypothetical protein
MDLSLIPRRGQAMDDDTCEPLSGLCACIGMIQDVRDLVFTLGRANAIHRAGGLEQLCFSNR